MKQNDTRIEETLTQNGYDIYFENLNLENELLDNLNETVAEKVISWYSFASNGNEPLDKYLDYIVVAADYFNKVANNEIQNANIIDIFKQLDVSDSLTYMLGEGLDKPINKLQEEYNFVLEMMDKAAPFLNVTKRYPFTEQMKQFCRLYLSYSFKPIAQVMIKHQQQLKKTTESYKKIMIEKKNSQPGYILAKIAGSFVGGIAGSLAVTALFAGRSSQSEKRFSYELSIAHQTWYQIQNSIHRPLMREYTPRVYHLYLSIIGGLFLQVNKDLQFMGVEMAAFYPNRSELDLVLSERADQQYKNKIESILSSEQNNESEIFEMIRILASQPYLTDITDPDGNLYIERLYVRYLYFQSISLAKNGTYVELPADLPAVFWKEKGLFSSFDWLLEEDYIDTYETISEAFKDFTEEMGSMYVSIVELNQLYDYADKKKEKKILPNSSLSLLYVLSTFIGLEKLPPFLIEDIDKSIMQPIIDELEEPDDVKNKLYDLLEKWIPSENKSVFSKLVNRFKFGHELENAIMDLDYCKVEKLLKSDNSVNKLNIKSELIKFEHRTLLKLLSKSLTIENVRVDTKVITEIIHKNDCEAMYLLMELGLNPFMPFGDHDILAEVIISGTTEMVYEICNFCNAAIDKYKVFLDKFDRDQMSPYLRLYLGGYGQIANQFPELVRSVPVEQREYELKVSLSGVSDMNACQMFEIGYDPNMINFADSEESFFYMLTTYPKYGLINMIHKYDKGILNSSVSGKTLLRHIYEIGFIEMADHFHDVLNIHDIGTVYTEDIESAVYNFEEEYLILLKGIITNTEEILKEIKVEAKANNEWTIIEMINRVLAA